MNQLATPNQLATLVNLMERTAGPDTSPEELTANMARVLVGKNLTAQGASNLIRFYTKQLTK